MDDKKQLLIQLILENNFSAIETLSYKLGISKEEVVILIKELQLESKLHGTLTSDENRFFKSEVKVSEAPVIEHENEEPPFLKYNTRPGLITAFIGFIVIVAGIAVNSFSTIQTVSDMSAILTFAGLCILMIGLYLISLRKTPD